MKINIKYNLRLHYIWGLIRLFLNREYYFSINKEYQRAISYASVMMHETGHTLGISCLGVDNWNAVPFGKDFFKFLSYRSCMNYCYTYSLIDYSDGSHGRNDHNDWGSLDLTLFQK